MKRKIFRIFLVMCFASSISCHSQQEKAISGFEVVEKVGARIQQIPDNESIKNVTGTINLTLKLNDSDYANLKSVSEKLFGKVISNPIKLEGKFISLLPVSGGRFEKFMLAAKAEFGNFYIYRNFDDITILAPEMGIEIQDKLSEIRKLAGNRAPQPPSEVMEGFGLLLTSTSFKTLFNQGKFWFYDSTVSIVEKSGKKFIELTKKDIAADAKITIVPDIWTISQIILSTDNATITANYKLPSSQKVAFIDYAPESVVIDAVDKQNTIRIELGSLVFNKNIDDGLFNLKKMKLSEFISSMAIKLMSQ
ncbi:MAG: hypothetical protein N2115_06470 [bacterium]|nr:hypothetical protein [bacterium]